MRAKYPSDLQSGNHTVLKRQKSGDGSLRTSSPSLPIYDRLQRAWAISPALLSIAGHAEYLCLEAPLFPAFHPPPQNNSALALVLASPSPSFFFSYDTAAAGLPRQCLAFSGDLLWLGDLRVGHPVGCTLQVYGLEIFCVAKRGGGGPKGIVRCFFERKMGIISSPVVRQRLQGPDMPGRTLEAASIVFHCMTISNINGSFLAFSIPRFSFSRPSFQTSDSPPFFPVTRLSLRRCRPAVMRNLDIWRAAAQAGGQSGAIRIIRENRNPESQQEAPFANIRGASSSSREAGRRRRPGAQPQSQLAQRRSVQRNGSKPSFALLSPRGNILRLTCAWHGGVADRICQFDLFLTFFFRVLSDPGCARWVTDLRRSAASGTKPFEIFHFGS